MEAHGEATLEVENVGGIESTSVDIEPGVTVLAGRNATNRTSLLRSLMAALGSDDVSLKADADAGRVELAMADERYTRTFERRDGTVVTGGDPLLDDSEAADLFAFLLATNEARTAAAGGGNIREVLLRPVDVEELEAEIEELLAERERIDDRIAELERVDAEMEALRSERAELAEELSEVEERHEAAEAAIADADADPADEELGAVLEELRDARAELADVRSDLETQREAIEALEDEREELREDRASLPDPGDDDLQAELDRLRERRGRLEERVEELGTVVEFNERMLEAAPAAVAGEPTDGEVSERLLADRLDCWTCGSEVERSDVEATLERLRDLREESLEELREVESRLESRQEERREREQVRARRRQLSTRLDRTEAELERRREQVGRLEADREAARERVAELEDRVETHRREDHAEFLERHREANELAVERDRLTARLEDLDERIEDLESRREERAELRERRESVDEELTDRRTRVERIEREAAEAFNEEMEALVDVLEYGNLERVWIERIQEAERFELHVVRATDDGAVYEDTVSNLSESERELVGLVFALAGYLSHEVYESVPFVLLDSLEAIDADRIAALVEYFESYAPYLVVALLEEDAAALDDDYTRVRDISTGPR